MIYAYIRVSTEMQNHASQRFEIEKFCRRNSFVIDKWVTESVSGTKAVEKRTLGRMFKKMHHGDLLVCTEISRLGRNMLMIMSILNYCSHKGIQIRTIKDGFELSDNINSKIIAFAFALAAEIERNLISQRTKEALAMRRSLGVRLGRPEGSSNKELSVLSRFDEIQSMIEAGMSLSKIAKRLKIHRNTLKKYLDKHFAKK